MKAKERFDELRKQKVGWFSLKTRLTLLVGAEVLISILLASIFLSLLTRVFPAMAVIPDLVWMPLFSLAVALIATAFLSRLFFDPVKKLREGMQKVADGDFSVRLDEQSHSQEIREMYAGFNMMVQELSATEILQSDFVSNVSHEFKTPINAIEGYATLLQDCEISDQQEYVEKILFNTRRLSALVGNILLLSKIENRSIRTDKSCFRVDEQIRQSLLALESAWTAKDIAFDVELDEIEYLGSELLLHHVWDNLISNAVKFSPHGGNVCMRLFRKDARVVFVIEDEGSGLSEEAQKHLFDKFYQADTSHKQEGNGLGLALVRNVLDACGGSVTAQNRAQGGARFVVEL